MAVSAVSYIRLLRPINRNDTSYVRRNLRQLNNVGNVGTFVLYYRFRVTNTNTVGRVRELLLGAVRLTTHAHTFWTGFQNGVRVRHWIKTGVPRGDVARYYRRVLIGAASTTLVHLDKRVITVTGRPNTIDRHEFSSYFCRLGTHNVGRRGFNFVNGSFVTCQFSVRRRTSWLFNGLHATEFPDRGRITSARLLRHLGRRVAHNDFTYTFRPLGSSVLATRFFPWTLSSGPTRAYCS